VDIRTHVIVHLENTIETQDSEPEERAEMITNLDYHLLELQLQAPPAPEDPDEADMMFGVNEE
jgi:hypothetical protein